MKFLNIRKIFRISASFIFLGSAISSPCSANGEAWRALRSAHSTVFYTSENRLGAEKVLLQLEKYHHRIETLTGNAGRHSYVLVESSGALPNGFAQLDRVSLYSSGITVNNLESAMLMAPRDWLTDVAVHETTHYNHLNNFGGITGLVVTILGPGTSELQLTPHALGPDWITEGIAVYAESRVLKQSGRVNESSYASIDEMLAQRGAFPSPGQAHYRAPYTPFSNEYWYSMGSQFMRYLAQTYGEQKFAIFFTDYGESLPLWSLNDSARTAFGKPWDELWDDWNKKLVEKGTTQKSLSQTENSRSVALLSAPSDLVDFTVDAGKVYEARRTFFQTASKEAWSETEIIERDPSNQSEKILTHVASLSGKLRVFGGVLYFEEQEMQSGFANVSLAGFGYVRSLWALELSTGKRTQNYSGNYRDYEPLPDGTILLARDKQVGFGSEIVKLNSNGTSELVDSCEVEIHSLAKNEKHFIFSAKKPFQNLKMMEKVGANCEVRELVQGSEPQVLPKIARNSQKVLFNIIRSGKYEGHVIDLAEPSQLQVPEESCFSCSASRFAPVEDGSPHLIYSAVLDPKGLKIVSQEMPFPRKESAPKNAQGPNFTDWPLSWEEDDAQRNVPETVFQDLHAQDVGYTENLKTLWPPRFHIPLFDIDRLNRRAGLEIKGEDVLRHFSYDLSSWYDFKARKPLFDGAVGLNFLTPLELQMRYDNTWQRYWTTTLEGRYPLLKNISFGVREFGIDLKLLANRENKVREIVPDAYLSAAFYKTKWRINAGPRIERKSWNAGRDRTGVQVATDVSQRLYRSSDFLLAAKAGSDVANTEPVFLPLRGYTEEVPFKKGVVASADVRSKVAEWGWAPWVFPYPHFDSLYASFFHEHAFAHPQRKYFSTGAELVHTWGVGFFLTDVETGLRVSENAQQKWLFEFTLKSGPGNRAQVEHPGG